MYLSDKWGDLFCVKQNYKTLQQIEDSGEIHLSDSIRKIRIPSEKWAGDVLMYNLDVVIAKKTRTYDNG